MDTAKLRSLIRTVPDWPKPGINFFDICSIVNHPEAFSWTVNRLTLLCAERETDAIVCPDARGFIWGAAVAYAAKLPLHLARKPGKLPGKTVTESYQYEYAASSISMQADAAIGGKRIMLIDDVLATGGTAKAIVHLLQKHFLIPASQIELGAIINIPFLGGSDSLTSAGIHVHALLDCDE
ncbi:MAG: hypothetical protein RLZZ244_2457 [Verrucomicrobiota bacterium]|jgi:adenine phosphoribosyltransferase